jgi:hypothetical protein
MPKLFSTPSEIARQLDAFKATLPPDMDEPPPSDFAAKLQWKSWQSHIEELMAELKAALEREAVPQNAVIG